ncbi:hypothetical protein GCM10010492_31270 [Saccharothrix mutabilis subsp. mutabilis]|uniref:Uncharacterized protein n=1 Tax=Saccharothrix mutabilis subsp. mutabilis TaxID=66855 RepID=A0ABP3DE84_9PSEU
MQVQGVQTREQRARAGVAEGCLYPLAAGRRFSGQEEDPGEQELPLAGLASGHQLLVVQAQGDQVACGRHLVREQGGQGFYGDRGSGFGVHGSTIGPDDGLGEQRKPNCGQLRACGQTSEEAFCGPDRPQKASGRRRPPLVGRRVAR